MTTFRYFAYGSNMLHERLRARCASAQAVGIGVAEGLDLSFSKSGRDGSGKATLLGSPSEPTSTLGVLFDIDERELVLLDRAEGVGYERRADIGVRHVASDVGGGAIEKRSTNDPTAWNDQGEPVITYVAKPETLNDELVPFDWYLALVIAGAVQNGLSPHYIKALRAIPRAADPECERPARLTAIRALVRAGMGDIPKLLG